MEKIGQKTRDINFYSEKNSGMNTYTGATFPLFLLILNSIKNCSFRQTMTKE